MLNLHFKSGLSYQSISSYRRIQRTIRKGDGRQTVKLVRWEVRICAVSVDEQFSAALFILGPGEPWWLKGFGLSGTKMEFLCGTMVGDFWFSFFHFLHIWASIDHSKLCSLCILDLCSCPLVSFTWDAFLWCLFPVTCEERHPILVIIFLFFHHLWVLLILLPCVHGECCRRDSCSAHEQQSYRKLQQCGAATSASTCTTAAAEFSAAKPVAAAAATSDETLSPFKQHPQPTQQPTSPNVYCPLSSYTQHIHFISSQFSVTVHIWTHIGIQFGTWAGPGIEQSWHDWDKQCQSNARARDGWPPHSFKHNGRAHFGFNTCPLCSGSSIRRLGFEQHHSVKHFSREQHFHTHLWLQWSHHQRGRNRAWFAGFQSSPQLSEWEYFGSGSWAKCGPWYLSGSPKFCQLYPRSSWHDGRQRRKRWCGWRSRSEFCSC